MVHMSKAKEAKNSTKYEDDVSFAYFDNEQLKQQFGEIPEFLDVTVELAR